MGISHATECQGKHFPSFLLFLINFGYGELGFGFCTSYHSHKGNSIPNDCRFTRDFYGRIMDETKLLDPRTFLNKPRLMMRAALPSEYLRRWAVMDDVFGMTTHYLGKVMGSDREPQMAVEQPFIPEDENLPATLEDAAEFFAAHGFERVSDGHIINPEVHGVTWYRQRDGVLVTDAIGHRDAAIVEREFPRLPTEIADLGDRRALHALGQRPSRLLDQER